jgi:hypothetical protein
MRVGGKIPGAFEELDPLNAAHLRAPALELPADVTLPQLEDRHTLLNAMDSLQRRRDESSASNRMDKFYHQAWDVLLSSAARDALDITREHPRMREQYGRHLWGQGALLACRLVEAGVRFVTLNLRMATRRGTPGFGTPTK